MFFTATVIRPTPIRSSRLRTANRSKGLRVSTHRTEATETRWKLETKKLRRESPMTPLTFFSLCVDTFYFGGCWSRLASLRRSSGFRSDTAQ